MAMVTESREPISTTNRMALSVSPNQRTASGIQQMLGSDCKLTSSPPRVSSRNLLLDTAKPRIIPSTTDKLYPMSMRFMVTAMPIQKLWSAKPSHKACPTPHGGGKRYGGQIIHFSTKSKKTSRKE